jgi:ankyrin repeat protein
MTRFFQRLFNRPVTEVTEEEALHALKLAITADDPRRIREIIAKFPALLNYADDDGATPLHWAAGGEKMSSVGCLVDLGADTKPRTKTGQTALDWANDEIRMGCPTKFSRKIQERIEAGPLR